MHSPEFLQFIQLISYISLTLMSITVAVISMFISYRNNFGWSPIILDVAHGLTTVVPEPPEQYQITIILEVWNRRNYPIAVRGLEVTSVNMDFDKEAEHKRSNSWYFKSANNAHFMEHPTIGKGEHKQIVFKGLLSKEHEISQFNAKLSFECHYFDPKTEKTVRLSRKSDFMFNKDFDASKSMMTFLGPNTPGRS